MQLILKAIEAWSCIYLFSADNLYLSCCIYAVEILYRVSKYKTQLDPTAYKTASFNACSFNPFHALSGSSLNTSTGSNQEIRAWIHQFNDN